MSFRKKNQDLLMEITDLNIANMVAAALRLEHKNDSSKIKNISARTDINPHTISKWYQAINTPSSAHLLVLAAIYPEVLKAVLKMIGRVDVWRYCLVKGLPEKMGHETDSQHDTNAVYGDKFVHLDLVIDMEIATLMNQRQLWFLGELQNKVSLRADAIVSVWGKTLRTARRDIQGMLDFNLIVYNGSNKTGHYMLVE